MIEKFLKYINENKLFLPKDKILLAVSGGRDSMAMIKLFEMADFDFGIAHFNHKTRSGDSDLDQKFIELFAKDKNIDFYTVNVDIEKLVEKSKENNFHDLARKKRYEWLENIRIDNNYKYIATGHHLDDNIETFLYKISKGSGINGLKGINSKINNIIRPLLDISREEIDEFIKNNNIVFREDSSNAIDKYDRNYIRHNIIPHFKKLNSNFNNRIGVTIDNIKNTNNIFNFLLESYSEKYIIQKDDLVYINKDILSNVSDRASFLFFLLQKYGFNKSESINILDSINKTGQLFSNDNFELLIERHDFLIRQKLNKEHKKYKINLGENNINGYGILIVERIANNIKLDYNSETKFLNADIISLPMTLRQWQKGDTFKPFGLKGKSKKIKDYFVNKKLSRFEKEATLLLLNIEEVCMVPGHDIAFKYRVKDDCEKLLSIRFAPY